MKVGYLVEYSKKTSFFSTKALGDNIEERKVFLCSESYLAELLSRRALGVVWSAKWVDVEAYQSNHGGSTPEHGFAAN